ncbi:MAG: hypothetical protein M1819_005947 [Sarea resinae]|nr:MAG: hypothetical protein M1819_005947 [Sarea resinae]
MSFTSSLMSDLAPDSTPSPSLSATSLSSFSSSIKHITSSAFNASSYLNPSPKDLLMVVPRMVRRVGSFAFFDVPDQIDSMLGRGFGGSVIAEATGHVVEGGAAAAAPALTQGAAAAALGDATNAAVASPEMAQAFGFQNIRNFGGIFSYLTSKWALGCITMAIILNRTQIYASARRHVTLNGPLRLLMRLAPIIIFTLQVKWLLQAIRCQSSPAYPLLRYGDADKQFFLDFSGDSPALHRLSSGLLWWQDEQASCAAVNLIRPSKELPLKGSLSLLWPLFLSLFLSQFVETLSSALQGRQPLAETGMTLFEHSLAFAEAEAMIGNYIGWATGSNGSSKSTANSTSAYRDPKVEAALLLHRSLLMDVLNVPPEVLLIGLISSLSHLSSHILAVVGLQARYRLINTGVWGICFMSAFVYSFLAFSPEKGGDIGILRFPTVCIVGFIPHLLILVGIFVCASIYFLAVLFTAMSPPPGIPRPRSLKERFIMANENLQASIQLSSIRISMYEDFYTTLLKIGFTALTAASEAVYLNEGRGVEVRRWTWLEEERMKEIESARGWRNGFAVPQDLQESVAEGVGLEDEADGRILEANQLRSGYARERKTQILKAGSKVSKAAIRDDGVGALQRGSRWIMAWDYCRGIFWLLTGWMFIGFAKLLDKLGIIRRPRWLRILVGRSQIDSKKRSMERQTQPDTLEFWMLSDNGELSLPETADVDVEVEMRRMRQYGSESWNDEDEIKLESSLYGWWKNGGWWGERDESGDFETEMADDDDDDTTSVLSMSTTADENDDNNGWETDNEDGRRTPTLRDPHPRRRSPTPATIDTTLDPAQLAALLDPKDPEHRMQARVLARHLATDGILTRSRYRHYLETEKSQVLTSTRYRPAHLMKGASVGAAGASHGGSGSRRLSPEEEAELLEHLILSRRGALSSTSDIADPTNPGLSPSNSFPNNTSASSSADPNADSARSWKEGAEGLGSSGPQCVVCQSNPRSILVWPCRCLSLCEDCRVALAMNNFGNCVCCRRDVVGFSRIFVP